MIMIMMIMITIMMIIRNYGTPGNIFWRTFINEKPEFAIHSFNCGLFLVSSLFVLKHCHLVICTTSSPY